jgi:hypothetical protein
MDELRRFWWVIVLVLGGGAFAYYVSRQPEPTAERLRFREDRDQDSTVEESGGETFDPSAAIPGRTYVSAYSHAYSGSGEPVLFAITLSVRNVDPSHSLVLTRVDYHATEGHHLRSMLDQRRTLPPLGTAEFFIPREDESGGSGANFIVEWEVALGGHRPVAEAVMLGSTGPVGYSFVTTGVDASDVPGAPAAEPAPAIEPAPEPPGGTEPRSEPVPSGPSEPAPAGEGAPAAPP